MENENSVAWIPDILNRPFEVRERIREIIEQYKQENDISGDIPPVQWLACLMEINEKLFSVFPRMLKTDSNLYNQYDKEKLYNIYNIYKRITLDNKQIINITGFITMIGIDKQTVYNISRDKSGSKTFDFEQNLREDNEQTLELALQDKANNPIKFISILNHRHGWSMPGVTHETSKKEQLSSRENLDQIAAADQPTLPE